MVSDWIFYMGWFWIWKFFGEIFLLVLYGRYNLCRILYELLECTEYTLFCRKLFIIYFINIMHDDENDKNDGNC